ncbi:hypothetical protein [Marinicrinis lubricantis]|uniref:DUF4179 domain-containing protein n=1 Tax=Marinicrinis lubricantis TaxID=2086470 RepID=A0ABW1IQX9_9BACL
MNNWRPDWDQRLEKRPFRQQRFKREMMDQVEGRLKAIDSSNRRKRWVWRTAVVIPVVMVMIFGGMWLLDDSQSLHDRQGMDGIKEEVEKPLHSSFEPQVGGDYEWWNSLKTADLQENDRTIVTLAKALMERKLGVWGGPTPDIWQSPEVKQPLERYDVSSPWVFEVYLVNTFEFDDHIVYRLQLFSRDSIPNIYFEMIDVNVEGGTNKISEIEITETDEIGVPGEGHPDYNGERTVVLKEDPPLDLRMTGISHDDMIRSLHVKYGDAERTFIHWSNVPNESYYPEVAELQVNEGKEKLLAIILTTGYGTEMYESELKVLRTELTEVSAANPVVVASSMLTSSISVKEGHRTYEFTLAGETRTFEYEDADAGFWFEEPGLGSIVRYWVEGNTIYASVPVQISPATFPVSIRLRYAYDGAVFSVVEAEFEGEE